MARHQIQFVASEIFPLAKTGGLADVCAALPAALTRLGADVHLVMPGYEQALDTVEKPYLGATLDDIPGFERVRVVRARTPDTGVPIDLIDIPSLYRDGGGLYQNADGSDRENNAVRFASLCHAATRLAAGHDGSAWRPNIVHCNDWHTGLIPLLLRNRCKSHRIPTVFTVHNMAFQGLFPWEQLGALQLPAEGNWTQGLEFYGKISFLKSGLFFSDFLTTVSPTYAREILSPEYGYGLERLVEARGDDVAGILNGIDGTYWSPSESAWLASPYSASDTSGKRHCKLALQKELGLIEDDEAPLIIFVGRLTWQKMADIVCDCLPKLLESDPDCQFALLGEGDRALEEGFRAVVPAFPGRVSVRTAYSESRAHRFHAGGDILIHGSRFEPCGLTQLYAMQFGTIPVVRPVGGLADTVVNATERALAEGTATGFYFDDPNATGMLSAIRRAIQIYKQPLIWRRMQMAAMSCDFNWEHSARKYLEIYEKLTPTLDGMSATAAERAIA